MSGPIRLVLALTAHVLFSTLAFAGCDDPGDITEALGCLPGVTYKEIASTETEPVPPGYRRFELTIEQPVDHFDPARGTFRQRLALLHRDAAEPMVLQTSGYKIFAVRLSALAGGFGTNQLQVEHRFFEQSTPAVLDWGKLDIVQSAHDFHRVTETFKRIYKSKWVNTGGSKGGMTSVYHRRFFPGDLDGTVADVAPHSYTTEDPRYVKFVAEVGGERYRQCREKLESLQLTLFRRRGEVLPHLAGTYVYLGGKSVAFEHAVIELPFIFWQYLSPEDPQFGCDRIPGDDAPAALLASYVTRVSPLTADADLFIFMPYYFQAATELGAPASELAHLAGYREHDYSLGQYLPPGKSVTYSDKAMRDVERWVRTEAKNILFVYGELDPWSAAAFPRDGAGQGFHWLEVPGGNHGANLFKLTGEDKEKALAAVRGWLGKRETDGVVNRAGPTLEEIEHRMRHRHGIL